MIHTNVIGIDLAKRIFHCVELNQDGEKINSKKLNRDELLLYFENTPKDTLVAMEACSGSNYWGQEFKKLGLDVKLLKTIDVKAYAKSKQKNDTNDALGRLKSEVHAIILG